MGKHTQFILLLALFLVPSLCVAYNSYTVGGNLGWTTSNSNSIVNYTSWASNFTFSLGDSLEFHYTQDHTVIQTDNVTTYNLCDGNTPDDDTVQVWSSLNSTGATVRLTKTGDTYFFCSASDGDHCINYGMKFTIHVVHGQGLPPASSPAPQNGDDGDTGGFPDFDTLTPPPPPPPAAASPAVPLHSLSLWMVFLLLVTLAHVT